MKKIYVHVMISSILISASLHAALRTEDAVLCFFLIAAAGLQAAVFPRFVRQNLPEGTN